MSQADLIRHHLYRNYFQNCSTGSKVQVRAGDVHKEMGLQSRMPTVCSVLDGKKLANEFSLELIERKGPAKGANVFYTFKLLDGKTVPPGSNKKSEPPTVQRVVTVSAKPKFFQTAQPLPSDAIYLVSCVGAKLSVSTAAKDLYISNWFVKARCYVESQECSWFILSAEYGFVDPEQVITPYEKTLNTMGVRDRREWAGRVLEQINDAVPDTNSFVFLAGQRYREFLLEPLRTVGKEIFIPMEGLTIGRQLSWLGAQVQE